MGKIDRVKQRTKRYGKRKRIFYKKEVVNDVNNEDSDKTNNVNNPEQTTTTQPSTPTRRVTPIAATEIVPQKKVKNIASSQCSKKEPVTRYRFINLEILNSVVTA